MKNRKSILFLCITIHAPLLAMLSNVRTALGALHTVQQNKRAIRSFATEDKISLNDFLKQGTRIKTASAKSEHSERFKKMLQTRDILNSWQTAQLLEDASKHNLVSCMNELLKHCETKGIDIQKVFSKNCKALHYAQSKRVAQRLLDAGMNINTFAEGTIPLHDTPDHLIPFFLARDANATIEDGYTLWDSMICRFYTNRDENPETTGWSKPLWITPTRCRMSSAMLTTALKDSFSKKELFKKIHTFCNIIEDNDGRDVNWTEYHLHLTPVALALREGNLKRLQLFLKHAKSDEIILQLPKLTFLSRFLSAFFPSRITNYNECALLLADYKRDTSSRIQE